VRCQAELCPSRMFSRLCPLLLAGGRNVPGRLRQEPQQQGCGVACQGQTGAWASVPLSSLARHKIWGKGGFFLHAVTRCYVESGSWSNEPWSSQSAEAGHGANTSPEQSPRRVRRQLRRAWPPAPARQPPGTLVHRRSLDPFCRRNHTLRWEIHHFFFFFFMLHCGFNKDMNMQSTATRQRELGTERSDACQ